MITTCGKIIIKNNSMKKKKKLMTYLSQTKKLKITVRFFLQKYSLQLSKTLVWM